MVIKNVFQKFFSFELFSKGHEKYDMYYCGFLIIIISKAVQNQHALHEVHTS